MICQTADISFKRLTILSAIFSFRQSNIEFRETISSCNHSVNVKNEMYRILMVTMCIKSKATHTCMYCCYML